MNGNRPSYPIASTISLWWGGTHSYAELSPSFPFDTGWGACVTFRPTGEVMIGDYQIGMIREGKV